MKINNVTKYQSKLVKLKLIKTKIYKENNNHFIRIEDIISRLKKALHIIYKYHTNNKHILFIGTPFNLGSKLKNLIKASKHSYIPESVWMNGIFTNQESCFKYLLKNQQSINRKISTILFKTKKKSDLIVILDSLANSSALNESYLSRIPVVSLNVTLDNSDLKSSYKVPGNFKFTNKKTRDNFFYALLSATLKKAQTNYELHKRKRNIIKKPFTKKFKKIFRK